MIKLQLTRQTQGLSIRKLGRLCDPEIDPSDISKAEKRGLRLYDCQLERLAKALNFDGDPAELLAEVEGSVANV